MQNKAYNTGCQIIKNTVCVIAGFLEMYIN